MQEQPRVAVMGAGAVGCYFGGMLARGGTPVTLIARPARAEAIQREGLFLDAVHFQGRVPVAASADLSVMKTAQIVLFCVKTVDTELAAKELRPHLAPEALVISLQNGVDNVERIRSASGIEAIPGVVYVAAEMTAPARVKHSGRGDLILGEGKQAKQSADLQAIAGMFERAGVPCRVSDQIAVEQWTKMVLNCAYNAISAVGRANYGAIAHNTLVHQVMIQAITEAVAVARAAGVPMNDVDMYAAGSKLGDAMSQATSSTAQDIVRGKPTEIDSLNGYIARRGKELGVATPVNQTLHALVKLLEQSAVSVQTQRQAS
ncbi:MAG TPA: ketopantoate reductase family protein [Terriglobales bacterium]|nr:ketopantoate reductase family protein [Terriglobales bacterium]